MFFPTELELQGFLLQVWGCRWCRVSPWRCNHVEVLGSVQMIWSHGMSVVLLRRAIGELWLVWLVTHNGPAKGSFMQRQQYLVVVWPVESTCTTWITLMPIMNIRVVLMDTSTSGCFNGPITQPMVRRSSCQHWRAIGQVWPRTAHPTQVRSLCIGRSSIPKWKTTFSLWTCRIERERPLMCSVQNANTGSPIWAGHKSFWIPRTWFRTKGLKMFKGGSFSWWLVSSLW